VESQPADSRNRLATIVSIAGENLPLCNSDELVALRQFPLSVNSGKPVAATNHKTGFQGEMREWAFRYQFFALGTPLNWISHIFWLKLLKPFFCNLKSKFSLNKKKISE
jgi:hypothetical protein